MRSSRKVPESWGSGWHGVFPRVRNPGHERGKDRRRPPRVHGWLIAVLLVVVVALGGGGAAWWRWEHSFQASYARGDDIVTQTRLLFGSNDDDLLRSVLSEHGFTYVHKTIGSGMWQTNYQSLNYRAHGYLFECSYEEGDNDVACDVSDVGSNNDESSIILTKDSTTALDPEYRKYGTETRAHLKQMLRLAFEAGVGK